MKIALVTTSYPAFAGDPSGHFVEHEARALAAAGHEVVVLAPRTAGVATATTPRVTWLFAGDAFGWPGALTRLRQRPRRALGALCFVAAAARALRRERPDRVVAHWLLPCGWPIAGSVCAELEVVVHGSDVALLERLPPPVARRIARGLAARAARVRCVSGELATRLLALAPELGPQLATEPCAIDVSAAPSRREARRRLGILPSERLVVVAARLIAEKRVEVALGAATLLPAEVVVLGDGPERARLQRRFPAVRFVGRVPRDQALTWIAAADLMLSASRREGAPTAIREARALGVPVVATLAGDLCAWAADDPGLAVVA